MGDWWTTKALIMLNLSLKTRQNEFAVNICKWSAAQKTWRLATTSASGCRACCTRTTATASWKRRSNRPLTSGFLLVETALKNVSPNTFLDVATFYHIQMGQNFRFHRISVWHVVHERGCLGLAPQRRKLLSICRNTKSQDDFSSRIFSVSFVLYHVFVFFCLR